MMFIQLNLDSSSDGTCLGGDEQTLGKLPVLVLVHTFS